MRPFRRTTRAQVDGLAWLGYPEHCVTTGQWLKSAFRSNETIMKTTAKLLAFCAPFLLVLSPTTTTAALVVFDFTATVSDVPVELQSRFSVGQSIVGSYTFESTTPPTANAYNASIVTFNSDIEGYGVTSISAGDIQIDNGATDRYSAQSLSTGESVGAAGTPFLQAIVLTDPTGTAFSDTSLPLAPPDLSRFSSALFTLDYLGGASAIRLTAQVNSLTAVPEPTGVALLPMLIVANVFAGRRRRS